MQVWQPACLYHCRQQQHPEHLLRQRLTDSTPPAPLLPPPGWEEKRPTLRSQVPVCSGLMLPEQVLVISLSCLITPLLWSTNSFIISVLVPLNLYFPTLKCYATTAFCHTMLYICEHCFRYPSCKVHPAHVIYGFQLQKFLMKTFKTDHCYTGKQKIDVISYMK